LEKNGVSKLTRRNYKMKNSKKIIIGIYSLVIIVVLVVFFYHSRKESNVPVIYSIHEGTLTGKHFTGATEVFLNSTTTLSDGSHPMLNPQFTIKDDTTIVVNNNSYPDIPIDYGDDFNLYVINADGVVSLPVHVGFTSQISDNTASTTDNYNSSVSDTATSSDKDLLYNLSPADRDTFLFTGNQNKDYQFVVDATNYGIQNHKDLIWDDIDFWNHRGMAFYSLGNYAEAGASFYHVLMRAPNDDVAFNYLFTILNDKSCNTATSSSNLK